MRDLLERKILFFAQDKRWRRIDLVTQDPPSPPVIVFSPPPPIYLLGIKEEGGISNVPPPTYKVLLQPKSGGGMSKETSPSLSQCVPIQARISPSSILLPTACGGGQDFSDRRDPPFPPGAYKVSPPPLYRCFEAVPPPSAATSMGKTFLSSSSSGGACNKISPRRQPGKEQKTHFTSFLFPSPPPPNTRKAEIKAGEHIHEWVAWGRKEGGRRRNGRMAERGDFRQIC